jgi:DNA-binding NtrC family response regulator
MNAGCLVCGNAWRGPARFCTVCGAPREELLVETRAGIDSFEMGEYHDAARWFEKALKKRPKSGLVLRDAGHAAYHLQDHEKALDRYRAALEVLPKLLDVHFNMGLLHMGRGHVNDALPKFEQAIELLHPIVPGRYYLGLFHTEETLRLQCRLNLGSLLRQRGELEKAVGQFRQVLEGQPRNVPALGNMGDCFLAMERYRDAVRTYQRVLKLLPGGPERMNIHNDLGVAYFKMGDLDRAVAQFKAVLKEDPGQENALHNLGQIYLDEGVSDRTRRDFEEFVRSARDPAPLLFALAKSMVTVATARKAPPVGGETLLVGESPSMRVVNELIKRAAASDATVIILGENGTGKELVARSIHQLSPRYDRPFVPIACSVLSESLLESELFGHEKGSFTGAVGRKIGKFEAAHPGTVFLDEIGEIPLSTQVKLLRFLQEREFERVGGNETVQVDVRVVAATNRDLKAAVREGRFREDLFYRLNVIAIEMPPLRDRPGDLELLAGHFLRAMREKRPQTRFTGISPEALAALRRYRWPGNVRELENAIERAVTLYDEPMLLPEHLPDEVLERKSWGEDPGQAAVAPGYALKSAEREVILRVLRESRFNKKRAAQRLGISRPTLYQKMQKYGLQAERA